MIVSKKYLLMLIVRLYDYHQWFIRMHCKSKTIGLHAVINKMILFICIINYAVEGYV